MANKTNENNIEEKTEEKQAQESEQYWKNIELFIHQANKISTHQGLDNTSSSLLYAAARFSAFNAVSKYKDVASMAQDKEEAIKYFTSTFNKMFQQNMDDYEKNFNQYFKPNTEDIK